MHVIRISGCGTLWFPRRYSSNWEEGPSNIKNEIHLHISSLYFFGTPKNKAAHSKEQPVHYYCYWVDCILWYNLYISAWWIGISSSLPCWCFHWWLAWAIWRHEIVMIWVIISCYICNFSSECTTGFNNVEQRLIKTHWPKLSNKQSIIYLHALTLGHNGPFFLI